MAKTNNGTKTAEVWDLAEGLPLLLQDGQTQYIAGPAGLPLEQIDGSGKVTYSLQDQLGNTGGLIDSSGNVVGEYTFDA